MCMYVCVPIPRLLKTIHMKMKQSNKSYCFSVLSMILAINTANGHGLSNKPKKSKVMQCLPFISQ